MDGEEKLTRREFFLNCTMAAGLIASLGTAVLYGLKFAIPPLRRPRYHKVYLSTADALKPGETLEFTDLQGKKALLVNMDGKFIAFSLVCTHLGCIVEWNPEKREFYCPCHQGRFDAEGKVISGPPPRPLDRFEVVVEEGLIYAKLKEV